MAKRGRKRRLVEETVICGRCGKETAHFEMIKDREYCPVCAVVVNRAVRKQRIKDQDYRTQLRKSYGLSPA